MPNVLQGLETFAPTTVQDIVRRVARPELAAALRSVRTQPSTIKSYRANLAEEVIDTLDDPAVLAEILLCGDHRQRVRLALARHRLNARIRAHARPDHELFVDVDADNVDAMLAMISANPARFISALRVMNPEHAGAALNRVLTATGSVPTEVVKPIRPLLVDAVIGRIPGVEVTTISTALRQAGLGSLVAALSEVLAEYDEFTADETVRLLRNGLPFPFDTIGRISDATIDVLLEGTQTAYSLIAYQLVTDPERVVLHAGRMTHIQQVQLMAATRDPVLINRYLPAAVLQAGVGYRASVAPLLSVRGLSDDAVVAIASLCAPIELRALLNNELPTEAHPELVRRVVDVMLREDYCGSTVAALVGFGVIPVGSASTSMLIALDHVVANCRDHAPMLFNQGGELAKLATEKLVSVIGDDPRIWDTALNLLKEWVGTVDELGRTAKALALSD